MQNELVLAMGERVRSFFKVIDDKWIADLQDFIHQALPKIVVILIFAWVATRILKLVTTRILKVAERHAGGMTKLSQVRTLTSVIRATGIGIIIFIALMEILPMLGFKLEPLLASAGVAGVAIGLAAQTIVKDCLNGFLILIEDQYNVGDVVKLAGLGGTVEGMTLRRTMLRDGGDGTLYIIPNSQITTVANQTRDFSVSTISVSVDFSAHPDEVMKVLNEVALSVRNDPQFKDVFLSDPKLLGVDSIKGSQVIYLVQLRTRPNQQWAAQRELHRRIQIALSENHILPGDPLRVFGHHDGPSAPPTLEEPTPKGPDPTAAKPNEINPLTGEGMG